MLAGAEGPLAELLLLPTPSERIFVAVWYFFHMSPPLNSFIFLWNSSIFSSASFLYGSFSSSERAFHIWVHFSLSSKPFKSGFSFLTFLALFFRKPKMAPGGFFG